MADGRDYFRASIDTSQFDRDATHIRGTFSDISRTAETEGARIDNSLKKIGATIAGVFTLQKASEFAKDIANVRGEFQQLEIAFETMLGSKAKSDALMSQLIDTAAKTPFDLTGVANGAKQLLAYGTASEKVNETLIRLGDIASGLSIPLNDLVYLYGTSQVQGRLFSKDIYQFMGRGIPIIKELSKELKVSEDSVMELVSAGKVGFPELQRVIENLTDQGGMFSNLMEKQSASITGQIANLEDAYDVMLNEIGKKSEETFTSAIDIATVLVENYEIVGNVIAGLIATYGTYKAAVIALNFVQSMQTKIALESALAGRTLTVTQGLQAVATKQLSIAQAMLNKTMLANPYVLATMALVGLGYAIYKLVTYQTDAEKAQSRLNDAMKEAEKSSISESRELARLKGELSAATKGTDEYNTIKEKIVKNYGKYYDGLEQEIEKVGLLEGTYNKLTEAIQRSFGARQYDSFMRSEQENLDNIMSENLGKIQDKLIDKLGDEAGSKYYAKIRDAVIKGNLEVGSMYKIEGLDSETQGALDKISGKASNDWIQNYAIEGYIQNIVRAQKLTDEMDKKAKLKFGIEDVDKTKEDGTETEIKKVKTLAEQTDEARKAVAKLKQELADLRSGKAESGNYAKDIEEKAKELKTAEDKLSYILTGKASSSSSKSTSDVDKKKKEAQDKADLAQKIKNNEARAALDARSVELDNQQKMLDILDDGFEKQQKQIDLNHKKDILAIEKRAQELIETRQQAEKDLWEQEGAKGTFVAKTQTIADLPAEMQTELITSDIIANKVREKATDDLLKSLLSKYQDYNARRIEVEKQFQKDLNELQKLPESKEKDAAIAQLEKERKAAIKSINEEESAELVKTSDLFVRLFTDASQQTVKQIRKVIDETQELYNYLKNTKDEDITDNFGFTAEQLRTFKGDAEQLKAILDGLISKKRELAGKSEFQAFSQSIGDAIKKIEKGGLENIGAGISDIGSAVNQFAPQVKKFGEDLGTIFGDEKLAEDIGLATDALSGLATTGAGVGQIMSGDVVGGIQSVVSGVSSLVGVFGKLKDRKKEKEIKRLQEQVELLEKAYQKLGRAIDKAYSKDASELIGQQNEALEKQKVLIQQQIKAEKDKKKTDKGRIKEWEQQIEEIDLLIEENKEKAIDAIFGQDIKSAIDEFANAYVDAWSAGEDRAKAMKDVVKKMIKGVIVEMLKSDLAPTVEKIRNKIQEFLTDGIIDSVEQAQLDKIIEEATKQADNKYSWADKYLDDSKNDTSQQASRGGFETMSQDVGQSLDGRFASFQMSAISIDGNVKNLVAIESESLQHIKGFGAVFQELRNIGLRTMSHLENIEKYTKYLPEIANDIQQVKQNTSKL